MTEGKSTKDAIKYLTSTIDEYFDDSKPTVAVFINHEKLMKCLEDSSFRRVPFILIQDQFSNRDQSVQIGDAIIKTTTL